MLETPVNHPPRKPRRLSRPAAIASLVPVAFGALALLIVGPTPGAAVAALAAMGRDTTSVDAAVADLAAAAAWLVLGWLAGSVLLTALARLPGRFGRAAGWAAGRVTPAVVRRLLETVMGVAIAAGVGATGLPVAAAAAPRPPASTNLDWPAAAVSEHDLDWPAFPPRDPATGSRLAPPVRPLPSRPGPPRPQSHDPVVVARGDSLWLIAGRWLGPGATSTAIAAAWPRWYTANRTVIGPDPDLLQPGQRLAPPTP